MRGSDITLLVVCLFVPRVQKITHSVLYRYKRMTCTDGKMDFRDRIACWQSTCALLATNPFPTPKAKKAVYSRDECKPTFDVGLRRQEHYYDPRDNTISVVNEDCLVVAERLVRSGYTPLVLIMADHRFAGGDVNAGSGAQEENIFRRTNCSEALRQEKFYPIWPNEAVLCTDVTVFRAPEDQRCVPLEKPFFADFIACPALHNPRLTECNALSEEDEQLLRKKIRLIFETSRKNGNGAVVMGPMGCGAWRNPPHEVARVMYEEHLQYADILVVVACLEVDPRAYIVLHRDKPSNFAAFEQTFSEMRRKLLNRY